jgi:hypothetical protein
MMGIEPAMEPVTSSRAWVIHAPPAARAI